MGNIVAAEKLKEGAAVFLDAISHGARVFELRVERAHSRGEDLAEGHSLGGVVVGKVRMEVKVAGSLLKRLALAFVVPLCSVVGKEA